MHEGGRHTSEPARPAQAEAARPRAASVASGACTHAVGPEPCTGRGRLEPEPERAVRVEELERARRQAALAEWANREVLLTPG